MYSDDKNDRFIEHIINMTTFCISCGESCDDCRTGYGQFSNDITGILKFEQDFPAFLDDPDEFLPESMPQNTDIVIAINIHQDILSALPEFLDRHKIPSLMVPIENGDWVPMGLQKQVEEDLNEYKIQSAFPRPYCSLKPNGQPIIDEFISYFKMGYPIVDITVTNGKIANGIVQRTSPCGCMFYLNRELIRYNSPVDVVLKEVISKGHHSYPCNANMSTDIALNEAPLHIAGYIHREVVYKGIQENIGKGKNELIDRELKELEKMDLCTPKV